MFKKFSITLLEIFFFVILCGCTSKRMQYVPYIGELGPNELNCKYFYYYHYFYKEDNSYSALIRYDVDTKEKHEIYVVDNPDKQRINDYYGFDEGVIFVYKEHKNGSSEYLLVFHDNEYDQDTIIARSSEDIIVIGNYNSKPIVKIEGKYYSLENDEGEYNISEMAYYVGNEDFQDENILEIENEEGIRIVFSKKIEETNFKYQVGDRKGDIDALTNKYSSNSGLTDNYVVEDEKVIGVVQYADLDYRHFYESKKYIRY
ncbi:hypothetical protein [Butyrivibrio proteoclasticus]|uniref:hypothetical protein n=1 Tax=Butyrivibrio proteoclasticus TaxID=43305 RepID=UPI00047D3468|nr:hypothetical protein [Butyrivibrio proteoclasticus]